MLKNKIKSIHKD